MNGNPTYKKATDDPNFISVIEYTAPIDHRAIMKAGQSIHLEKERRKRMSKVYEVDKDATIDRAFLVDRGHKDGKEIHAVSTHGIIYVLNYSKFQNNNNALVTAMFARPNQLKRMYADCGYFVSPTILTQCSKNCGMGLNR